MYRFVAVFDFMEDVPICCWLRLVDPAAEVPMIDRSCVLENEACL